MYEIFIGLKLARSDSKQTVICVYYLKNNLLLYPENMSTSQWIVVKWLSQQNAKLQTLSQTVVEAESITKDGATMKI